MPTEKQQTDAARKFIEDVARINKEHGMATTPSRETYDAAIRNVQHAFSWVSGTKRRGAARD